MSSTFGGSRSSAELPVVCLLVGAPGFDPGRLQQSAAPVYKTEPHASADASIAKPGVPGSTRTSTERALDAFPLPLGYRHTRGPGRIRTYGGLEPAN